MNDDPIPIKDARDLFYGRPSISCLWRWCLHGCRRSGRVIRLDHVREGSRIFIRPSAVEAFRAECEEAQHAAMKPASILPTGRTPKMRTRDIERAKKQLALAGI